MKTFLPAVLLVVCIGYGCATRKEATYQPVPRPSNVDPALGKLATVTGTRVYADKEAGKPAPAAKVKPAKQPKPAKQSAAPKDKPIVTPESGLTGKVMTYNDAGRFVVVSFPLGRMPQTGSRLFIYRNGLKTGEIKITGPQRDDNIVADLATGEAQPGDEVRDK
jgi:hypothetical protein